MFGFIDAMSGIPDRRAEAAARQALLARGANPNARMTEPPTGIRRWLQRRVGATPFLLAAAAADVEMMRLLLAAGARSAN